jgi:FemAB-related protein (PEP-CTERM system-associated)
MSCPPVSLANPDAAWDSFVRAHPAGSAFHLSAWQRVIESAFRHQPRHLIARKPETSGIAGILPLFLVRSLIFGRMLVSTPQGAYGGILADSDDAYRALLDGARRMAEREKVEFLELRNFRNEIDDPSLLRKDLYVTFRTELTPDVEKHMLAIPRKTRAEIRIGISNNLEFRKDDIDLDLFYSVYSRSLRDLGTPIFTKRLFTALRREFGDECRIFSVHSGGRLASAVLTLFYKDEVVPYYGASFREFNRLGVNNFMYWMLIKYGCENGYRVYDFGRSKKGTGSFDFKKRWGMATLELPYQFHLVRRREMPDTSPLNPRFSRMIRAWQRLPMPVANTLGPLISRHLT